MDSGFTQVCDLKKCIIVDKTAKIVNKAKPFR